MQDASRRRGPVRPGAVVTIVAVLLVAVVASGCSGSRDRLALPSPSGTVAGTGPSGPSGASPASTAALVTTTVTSSGIGPEGATGAVTGATSSTAPSGPSSVGAGGASGPARPGSCPSPGPLPAGVANRSAIRADLDGDGAADDVVAFAVRSPAGAGDWRIRVSFAAGGGTESVLAEDPAPGVVRVLGSAALGGTEQAPGPVTLFAWTGSGASARIVGLFRVAGCALAPLTSADGQPAAFMVGGSVGHQEGLRCAVVGGRSALVEVLSEPVGPSYRVTRLPYVPTGTAIAPVGPATVTDEAQPPAEAGRVVGCGDVPVVA
jgi:hypothetical protein